MNEIIIIYPSKLQISLEIRKDVNKCIICQKMQDNKGSVKLTSTEKGRRSIIDSSNCLKDDLLESIPNDKFDGLKYHVNTCYPRYIRTSERYQKKTETAQTEQPNDKPGPSETLVKNRPKRKRC